MPLDPSFPCCDFPEDVEPPSISDSGQEGKCHPTGTSCPKGFICLTHTEPSDLQPLTVCQCVKLDKNGFVPWEYLLQDPPWTHKGRELLVSISDTLPYMVSRTVALKLKSIGWYPTDLSYVELNILFRTPLTKRGTDYHSGKPTLPTPPMLPYYGAPAGCEYMMVRVDPHTGEYPPLDLTCLLYIRPKPWNPKDPCLLRFLAEYLNTLNSIDEKYTKIRRLLSEFVQTALQTIKDGQLICDRLCTENAAAWWSGQVDACLDDCNTEAKRLKDLVDDDFTEQLEEVDRKEKEERKRAVDNFFLHGPSTCGYTSESIPMPLFGNWGINPLLYFSPPYGTWDDTYSPPDTVDSWGNPIY